MEALDIRCAAHAALLWHGTQTRKYTGEPYITHCAEVAALVQQHVGGEEPVAAAWLHDVIEDTHVDYDIIAGNFGHHVAKLVQSVSEVSRPEDGNRAVRKAKDRAHYARACPLGKAIKVADLISNTRSIVAHDPDFAKVYLAEKALLLPMLNDCASYALWNIAFDQLREAQRQIDALFKLRRVHPEQRHAFVQRDAVALRPASWPKRKHTVCGDDPLCAGC